MGSLKTVALIGIYDCLSGALVHLLKDHHSQMIDCLHFVSEKNWLVSIGRDYCIVVWKVINQHLVAGSEGFLCKVQTSHKDFVRSMIHSGSLKVAENKMMLLTGSEDKTVKMFVCGPL